MRREFFCHSCRCSAFSKDKKGLKSIFSREFLGNKIAEGGKKIGWKWENARISRRKVCQYLIRSGDSERVGDRQRISTEDVFILWILTFLQPYSIFTINSWLFSGPRMSEFGRVYWWSVFKQRFLFVCWYSLTTAPPVKQILNAFKRFFSLLIKSVYSWLG